MNMLLISSVEAQVHIPVKIVDTDILDYADCAKLVLKC